MAAVPRLLRRDHPSRSPSVLMVLRGMAIVAIVWQGAWLFFDTTLWPRNLGNHVAFILVWGALISWLLILIVNWGPWSIRGWRTILFGIDVGFLLAAAAVLLVSGHQPDPGTWLVPASFVNLAVAISGLIFRLRTALVVTCCAAAGELLLLLVHAVPGEGLSWSDGVLFPAYAIAVGISTSVAQVGVVRAANRAERAQADLLRAEARTRSLEQVRNLVVRQQQRLHETVLNTLNAIARGGVALDEALGRRCRDAVAVLDGIAGNDADVVEITGADWETDLADDIHLLETSGIAVTADVGEVGRVPRQVYESFLIALREACTNARKHSGATSVRIMVTGDQGRFRSSSAHLKATVTDDGVGFDAGRIGDGFGLRMAIGQAMDEVNGQSQVTSSSAGTTVMLRWDGGRRDSRGLSLRDLGPTGNAFAAPVLGAFGAFALLAQLLTWPALTEPWWGMLAWVIYCAISALLIITSWHRPMPGWAVAIACLAAPLVYVTQHAQSYSAGTPLHWADWSSVALVAMFIVIGGAGPWWAWLLAIATWVVIQGDFPGELLRPGSAVIIASALYARSVRLNARRYDRATERRLAEQAEADAAEQGFEMTRLRYAPLSESDARGILQGISDACLSPADPQVRSDCAYEEQFIRAVMRIAESDDCVHRTARTLLPRVRERHCTLHVDLTGTEAVADSRAFMSAAEAALDAATEQSVARLSVRREGDEVAMRLVVDHCHPARSRSAVAVSSSTPVHVTALEEEDLMAEARYAVG